MTDATDTSFFECLWGVKRSDHNHEIHNLIGNIGEAAFVRQIKQLNWKAAFDLVEDAAGKLYVAAKDEIQTILQTSKTPGWKVTQILAEARKHKISFSKKHRDVIQAGEKPKSTPAEKKVIDEKKADAKKSDKPATQLGLLADCFARELVCGSKK